MSGIAFAFDVLAYSAIFVLVVLGLGVIASMMGVFNFAHGEFVLLGAYAREVIFVDDEDRLAFFDLLASVIGRFNWLPCLLPDDQPPYPFILETPQGNLLAGMRQLNGVYLQRCNRRQGFFDEKTHRLRAPTYDLGHRAIILDPAIDRL